ncbi:hypothetical protein C8Q76DRAFT_795167 [Earliella scabrosa]|nr:hypothetical protein C8Q76DRAFT_795167 [Earliella scabrosa]
MSSIPPSSLPNAQNGGESDSELRRSLVAELRAAQLDSRRGAREVREKLASLSRECDAAQAAGDQCVNTLNALIVRIAMQKRRPA